MTRRVRPGVSEAPGDMWVCGWCSRAQEAGTEEGSQVTLGGGCGDWEAL